MHPEGFANRYAVGQPYNPSRTHWPEGPQWRLSDDGVELLLFYRSPTEQEVTNIRQGEARFALLAGEHALILAHKFGDLPWADSPWQACRQTDAVAGLVVPEGGQSLVVIVMLVDADTGIIRALRSTSWSAQFATAVRAAIRTQMLNRANQQEGDAEIDHWYMRYPRTPDLVRAADLTTRGGREVESSGRPRPV